MKYPLRVGNLIQLMAWYPLYPDTSFKLPDASSWSPNPDIPPGTAGMILAIENNTVQILTSRGIGWVGEHVLKAI